MFRSLFETANLESVHWQQTQSALKPSRFGILPIEQEDSHLSSIREAAFSRGLRELIYGVASVFACFIGNPTDKTQNDSTN